MKEKNKEDKTANDVKHSIFNKKRKIIIIAIIIAIIILLCVVLLNRKSNNKIDQKVLAQEEQEVINLNLEIKQETNESYKCLLTFTSKDEENKIKSIEYPKEEDKEAKIINVENENGKENLSIDYEIAKGDEDKKFKITTTKGDIVNQSTGYTITYMNNNEVFEEETQLKNKILSIINISPTQEGKHFIGYSKNKDATVPDYFEEGNYPETNKNVTLYAIYTDQKNGYTQEINNESLIGEVSKINESGQQEITVNGVTYTANVIVENNDLVLDGQKQVQGATLSNKTYEFGDSSKDVATANENAKNMVILKVNGNLTVNSNVTLTACKSTGGYGGPKGLFIYSTGELSNNGTIDMTARGAKAQGQDVYLWKNKVYEEESKKYEYVPAVGANGSSTSVYNRWSSSATDANGKKGSDGESRKTGGGGSGYVYNNEYEKTISSGAGGNGTSYSGGSGGGSIYSSASYYYGITKAEDGSSNGGSGGWGYTDSQILTRCWTSWWSRKSRGI